MANLSWSEQEVAGEFAGAVGNLVGLSRLRPDRAEVLLRDAVEKLDVDGRNLVVALAAQITKEAL